MINKILFVTLSNIGDVILTLPVLDALRMSFPTAKITVMVGPRPKEIFENSPHVERIITYDKHSKLREKIQLFRELSREDFDVIVDLRNSFFGAFLPARYRTSPFMTVPGDIRHMKFRHLYKVRSKQSKVMTDWSSDVPRHSLNLQPQDKEYIESILSINNIHKDDRLVLVAAGARSRTKKWSREKFVDLISSIIKDFNLKVILVGDNEDRPTNSYIAGHCPERLLDLSGRTSLAQLACLLKRASLLISNDSAIQHLASYLDVPVLTIFGPTNEFKYSPWSRISALIKKDIFCRPCEEAKCKFGSLECMNIIKMGDVLKGVQDILNNKRKVAEPHLDSPTKRILVVRTDRIGDVLLSTPVIKALRDTYPSAYIAMMVSPYTREIAEGNPYLDEAIIYDKDGKHKSWANSIDFALSLKKKKFDLSLVLHPTNRVHLVTFFAGIPRRVGYDYKLGFLLTDRIKHEKYLGQKHELEYNFDLLHHLGIKLKDRNLFMPIKHESEKWVDGLFAREGIKKSDKLLAVHPAASCPSKIWPRDRFAEVADKLAETHGFKILVLSGPKDMQLANEVAARIKSPLINLSGKTSVSQLASILKRCRLFISNDSGPVHIASAVGTPVVSIFGRSQAGLSPKRWGPVGENDKVLHKTVGCIECLAHNCVKEFACLKAISVDDVIRMAEEILR